MPKNNTLLEKALEIKVFRTRERRITEEEKELALAWANGEVSLAQVSKVLGDGDGKSSMAYPFLAQALREVIRDFSKEK